MQQQESDMSPRSKDTWGLIVKICTGITLIATLVGVSGKTITDHLDRRIEEKLNSVIDYRLTYIETLLEVHLSPEEFTVAKEKMTRFTLKKE